MLILCERVETQFWADTRSLSVRALMTKANEFVTQCNNLMALELLSDHETILKKVAAWVLANSSGRTIGKTGVTDKDMLSVIVVLCSFSVEV